jgi:ATP-dependent Lon protease
VLDPEQNSTFRDNYLGCRTTVAHRDVHRHGERARPHPGPLRDRMEGVVSLPGYTEAEKLEIAQPLPRCAAARRHGG